MKKVLLVSLATRFGGGETYLEQLVLILKDRVELTVFCVLPEVRDKMHGLGVATYFVHLADSWRAVARIPAGLVALVYLRGWNHIRCVVLNGHAPAALAPISRLLGFRTYVVAHISLSARTTLTQRLFLHRRYLISLRFAHKVICVSEPVAIELKRLLPGSEILTIPNWIGAIPPAREVVNTSVGPLQLLFVGRLVELKGLALLLTALRSLPGLSLTVVGEGAYRARFERMAEGMDVTFVGFQDPAGPYFRRADLFINPSLGPEGLPMVSLEAMSNSLPCILSDLAVHIDISDRGAAAMLFRKGSAEDLGRCISALVADPDLRRNLARRAHRQIVERFGAATATARYVEALEIA